MESRRGAGVTGVVRVAGSPPPQCVCVHQVRLAESARAGRWPPSAPACPTCAKRLIFVSIWLTYSVSFMLAGRWWSSSL